MDRRAAPLEESAGRIARGIRVERTVVVDHHHSVTRDRGIELKRGDAECKRALERGKCVLRREAARAAMPLQIERVRSNRERERAGERERFHSGDFHTTRPVWST